MRLLQPPTLQTETIDIVTPGGRPAYVPGRTEYGNVKILVQDKPQNDAELMWQRLKYGMVDSDMYMGHKVDKLTFEETDATYVLHGVLPVKVERTGIWEGRVLECKIDRFEVIPNEQD